MDTTVSSDGVGSSNIVLSKFATPYTDDDDLVVKYANRFMDIEERVEHAALDLHSDTDDELEIIPSGDIFFKNIEMQTTAVAAAAAAN
jgi:hypothetical protein